MLLARQGRKVLLVDRARFPSDKPISTHLMVRSGVAALGRWGLLGRFVELGAPPTPCFSLNVGPFQILSDSPDDGAATAMYAPRRYLLDKLLLDAAIEAGVEFREGFSLRELLWEDGRVVGVRGGARGGATVEERARVVVGADGIGSVVARETKAEPYHFVPTKTGAWWGYYRGVPNEHIHIWVRPHRLYCTASTNDGLTLLMAYLPIDDFHEFSANPEANLDADVRELVPELHERLHAGERVGQLLGTGHQPNFFRQSAGPGWALVGDAGLHEDSMSPTGMSRAFSCAEMLAEAIHAGLDGADAELDAAVLGYQARRDARWLEHWRSSVSFFTDMGPPTPERIALVHAMATRPEVARRFFAYHQGQEPEAEFLSPENLARTLAG